MERSFLGDASYTTKLLFFSPFTLSNFQLRKRSRIHFSINIMIKTQGSPMKKIVLLKNVVPQKISICPT